LSAGIGSTTATSSKSGTSMASPRKFHLAYIYILCYLVIM
jgi:hypothetical protein